MKIRSSFFIDFNILDENLSKLKFLAPNNKIIFMIKANAYGHGMVRIVKFAVEQLGITEFGCATIDEAKILRRVLPKHIFDIYVFSDVQINTKSSSEFYLNSRTLPVISSLEDLEYILDDHDFRHMPLCLKFNTGMNRLGIELEQQDEVIKLLKHHDKKEIYHLFSHFSSASLSVKKKRPREQYDNFLELKQNLKSSSIEIKYSSMANSGAIEQQFSLDETHVRPGLMLYGPSALLNPNITTTPWSGKLIGRLETYILKTFEVKRGTPVGYGGTIAHDDGMVAVLALGYGDGISTEFQGKKLQYLNHAGTVLGRVNMDMLQLFFPRSQNCPLRAGDRFLMWGHDPEYFRNLCQQLKMIPYELLCQLTVRVPRMY